MGRPAAPRRVRGGGRGARHGAVVETIPGETSIQLALERSSRSDVCASDRFDHPCYFESLGLASALLGTSRVMGEAMTSQKRFAALLLAVACGCSSPLGGGLIGGEDPAGAGGGPSASSAGDAGGATDPGPMSPAMNSAEDGGGPVATSDAGKSETGAPPPPPPPSVFNGAGAFVASTAGDTHNAGQNCMNGCHNHGFTFAGTLKDGAGNGVAGAEVRLVDSSGAAITVHTGTNGNFHSATPFSGPAHVGARTATKAVDMVGMITAGGCNGCHATGGTATPIHVP